METKLADLEEANEASTIEESVNLLEKTFGNHSSVFKCEICDFVVGANDDLETHMKQKQEEPVDA